ncbi:MAG: hypothetical protein RL427_1132 [Bacteroidota bacterium]|jgi:hypothetical protein
MKKLYSLLLLVISSVSFAQTFYSENMGAPSATTLVTAYTGWQNAAPIVYSGTADVRATAVSSGYTGASGGGNVLVNAAAETFQIDGLNTSAYNTADIQLTFGYNADGNVTNTLTLEYSSDSGASWTAITYTPGATGWSLVTVPGNIIPSTATLSLRFTQNLATPKNNRIDDLKLSSVSASCTLALGTPTAVCEASTAGTDTYTVTIPYTGGGNATYTITPASGTVGGDNPTSVAAGNIVITGVAEGTNFSATITGGTCNLSTSANSPECKPINALPYSEPFNYTAGSALGTSQLWSNLNGGDDIVAVAGSLNYSGVTSTGNSVLFSGSGKESTTPFTSTTSGTLYAAFLVKVADLALMTDGNAGYFAGLCGSGSSDYKGRVFVKRIVDQYSFGFDTAGTTTNVETTLRNTGEVVYVVLGYDFDTNALGLWINPTAGAAPTLSLTPATPLTALGWFTLRQDSDANTPNLQIDELRIVTSLTDLGLTLGLNQNSIKGLKVYPNPISNGTLFIESAANATKTVVVYDVLGKQVLNTTTVDNAISVSSLTSGVYVVKITEEGNTATRKLVIK